MAPDRPPVQTMLLVLVVVRVMVPLFAPLHVSPVAIADTVGIALFALIATLLVAVHPFAPVAVTV